MTHQDTAITTKTTADTTNQGKNPQVVDGIRNIMDSYDTFLLDMWGVMHNGVTTYEGVLDVVTKLHQAGKELIILSNSSKRQDNSIKMLSKLGFHNPTNLFSQIITSGEVSYHLLLSTFEQNPADYNGMESSVSLSLTPQPWSILEKENFQDSKNRKVFCFGSGDGDEEYLNSCGWTLSSMEEANLIVARGTFTIMDGQDNIRKKTEQDDDYFRAFYAALETAAKRQIPMIVANPDKIRPDADRSPMPGTIGNAYEKALLQTNGGSGNYNDDDITMLVKYIGKPFSDVYEIALRNKAKSRTCMIGDALETDVAGGSASGIDTIWVVNDGIHNAEIQGKANGGSLEQGCLAVLEEFNEQHDTYAKGRKLSPTVIMPHFRW